MGTAQRPDPVESVRHRLRPLFDQIVIKELDAGRVRRSGLVIAIEPWFLQTTDEIYTDADGWTLRSADGSRGAHMEHTVAITADGPLVLTARS